MEKGLKRLINSILPALILVLIFADSMGLESVEWYHGGLAFGIIFCLTFFCYCKLKGRIFMAASTVVCVAVILHVIGIENLEMTWHVSVLGIGLGAFIFELLAEKLPVIRLLLAGCFWGLLGWDLFADRELEHLLVVCSLTYVIMVFVEWTRTIWKKQKSSSGKEQLVWLLPFLCLYFVLMLLMPAPKEPYDWKFVKDAYSWAREHWRTISQEIMGGEREDFEMVSSGFSEEGRLLGGVGDTGQIVMHIKGQKNLKTNVYLVGKVYDTFTGQQWQQQYQQEERERALDALETAYAVWAYDKENADNYINSTELQVTYQYFNTGYLFAPLKSWKIDSIYPYKNLGGDLVFEEKMSYGTGYGLSFLQLNVDHAKFYELMENTGEWQEEIWNLVQRRFLPSGTGKYSKEELLAHKEQIYKVYGNVPDLSPEISEYLDTVTRDAHSDVEKLKAIEAALASLEYTKTPGKLPEEIITEEAFLDYFLLENKKGFCSYFASAFVLLARAEGIPARYVEGFCVPVEGGQETVVSSDRAHAWPEAYIEGVGWIPFEPTPGYEEIRYTPWEMVDYRQNKGQPGMMPELDLEEEEQEETSLNNEEVVAEEIAEEQDTRLYKIIIYTVLFVTASAFVIWSVDGYLTKRRYDKATLEEKVMAQLQKNIQILARLGYRRADTETLAELERRAWAVMCPEQETGTYRLQFLRLYEDVLYGERAVSEEMLQEILKERQILMDMLKKWKYLLYIYCKVMERY